MVTQYDEKGKIFTEVISKQPVRVMIQTQQNIIRGDMHIRPETRLKDEVNNLRERFLAITDASVSSLQDVELFQTSFLVINMDHIVWVSPLENITK
jgi:hypothetical protein